MKLSVFINNIDSTSEVFLKQLFNELGKDITVEIISFHYLKFKREKSNYKVRILPRRFSILFFYAVFKTFIKYQRFEIKELYLLSILEYAQFKKIYFPFLYMISPFEAVLPIFLAKNKSVKVYTSIRGTEVTLDPIVKGNKIVQSYRNVISYVYKIHFLSEKLLSQFNNLDLFHSDVEIIYQGVDRFKFYFEEVPKDSLKLISVGRLDYIKGFEFLLLTCKKIKNTGLNFSCTIVGYGGEIHKLKYLIHDLELHENVVILQNVTHHELPDLLRAHNHYVHTHLVTGISNTMLEAFSCGLKVASFSSDFESYDVDALTNFFKEVERYNVDALATLICENWDKNFPTLEESDFVLTKFSLNYQRGRFLNFFGAV
jgi:colanic acid/amylovoran biosynthesis glycosyltransferase